MKILCLVDHLGSGGAQRQMTILALLFKERGHAVEVLTYYSNDFFLPSLARAQIPVVCLNEERPIKRILKVRKILRNGDQDAVLSFLNTPNFIACLSAIGGRNWSLVVGERSAGIKSFTSLKGRFFKLFNYFADSIVCNSYNASNMWVTHFPYFQNKISILYNPIIIDEIVSTDSYQPKQDGRLHIIIAAGYRDEKNLVGVIEAVNLLEAEYKQKLMIEWYGDINSSRGTAPYDEARELIRQYGIEKEIVLNSVVEDIYKKMVQGDVVGLFSHYEGLPNAICEGMMLGKPLIMTRVSDFDKLVDISNGFLCDADNPSSIADALSQSIDTPINRLIQMGENSKQKAKSMFNEESIVDAYLRIMHTRKSNG